MKTLCKKLLTGCLALAMACAMAIPTFAAEPQTRANIYQSYVIQSQTQGLNLHAEAYVNAPVYLATPATGWMLGRYGGTTKLYLTSTVGNSQLVIRYQGGNVLMAHESFDDGDTVAFTLCTAVRMSTPSTMVRFRHLGTLTATRSCGFCIKSKLPRHSRHTPVDAMAQLSPASKGNQNGQK